MSTASPTLRVRVLIPERTVYDGQAVYVSLPGMDGVIGVLPRHAVTMVVLDIGEMDIVSAVGRERVALGGGVALIRPDSVNVMATVAELGREIDIRRAGEARRKAEEALSRQRSSVDFVRLEAALHRAITRIRVAGGR